MGKDRPDELEEMTLTVRMRRCDIAVHAKVNHETRGFVCQILAPGLTEHETIDLLAGLIGLTESVRAKLTGVSGVPYNRGTEVPPPYSPRK